MFGMVCTYIGIAEIPSNPFNSLRVSDWNSTKASGQMVRGLPLCLEVWGFESQDH